MKPLVMMMSASVAAVTLSSGAWAHESQALDPAKIEAAKTPADHEAIAKAYESEALSFEKTAKMHSNLAQTYGQPGNKPSQAAQAKHCASVATSLKKAAQEERALAAEHRKMAEAAKQ